MTLVSLSPSPISGAEGAWITDAEIRCTLLRANALSHASVTGSKNTNSVTDILGILQSSTIANLTLQFVRICSE